VALLFLTLAEPGPLPAYVATLEPDGRAVSRLVLDSVLEIRRDREWRSGPGALGEVADGEVGEGRLAELAVRALRYAQALGGGDANVLAARLYRYGRRPASPSWRRRLGDDIAVARFCGLDGRAVARALDARFVEAEPRPFWRLWLARGRPAHSPGRVHKLYLSPVTDALPDVLPDAVDALGQATALKIGRELDGILRPDKAIVYFASLDDLHSAAARLRERFDGCPAHGVPFTAGITRDGLLSWGIDPPASSISRPSWRLWLAHRLAEELVEARSATVEARSATVEARSPTVEPWRAALARVRLDGVDTATWVPEARLFAEGT